MHHLLQEDMMRRHRVRRSEIQLALFQPKVERPEWKAMPPEVRETVMSLLVELFKHAAGLIVDDVRKKPESAHE
jgi:hypothetical protein